MNDAATPGRIDLGRFTFDALYLCGTPVERFRGEGLLTAVNDWYMGFIRNGLAVPLSFVIDVSSMLIRPGGTDFRNRWKEANVRPHLKTLALRYYAMLKRLQRQPVFEHLATLAQSAEPARRDLTVRTILRFLLADLSDSKNAYSFNTRELKLLAASPTPQGLRSVKMLLGNKKVEGHFLLEDPAKIQRKNEFSVLMELTESICNHFESRRLDEIVSPEERLMVELAANSPAGIARADYRFLVALLNGANLADEEVLDVKPRPIEDMLPLDSYETEGDVGGYVDVNRKRFANISELLPVEMSLWQNKVAFFHRVLNEGALHYVRENFEHVDRRLRLLFCFVVDSHSGMSDSPENVHPSFGKGMTPYVRARVLASLLLQDLARFLPREDIRIDFGFYLWSAATSGGPGRGAPRAAVDFSAWTPEQAADRFQFAAGLVRQLPAIFQARPGESDEDNSLDPDPVEFVTNHCRSRRYHCRHFVFLTSSRTWEKSLPTEDPGLLAMPHSGDSILVLDCDPVRPTVGVSWPRTLQGAGDDLHGGILGQLSDEQVRQRFLRTVALKADGRPAFVDSSDQLVEMT